jgi:hypothetical protein
MSTDPLAQARLANLQVLNRLTEIAMEMAEVVKDQVVVAAAEYMLPEDDHLGLLFSRIARSVRQTVMLSMRLCDGEDGRTKTRKTEPRPEPPPGDGTAKNRPAPRPHGERPERAERLDPDIDAELGDRSPAEIIAGICKDLGVPEDQFVWTEAGAGEPRSAVTARVPAQRGIPPRLKPDLLAECMAATERAAAAYRAARAPP